MLQEFALVGKGFSGRGVRVRMLDAEARDSALELAAKEAGPEATVAEWNNIAVRACICKMIAQVTEKDGFKSIDDVHAAKWVGVTEQQLSEPGGKMRLGSLFNAKDQDVLSRIYREAHEATRKEVDEIMGKGLTLAED